MVLYSLSLRIKVTEGSQMTGHKQQRAGTRRGCQNPAVRRPHGGTFKSSEYIFLSDADTEMVRKSLGK